MTNRDFYEKIRSCERDGLLLFMPRKISGDYIKVKVGKVYVALHKSECSFAPFIQQRLLTQSQLERKLNKSNSTIKRLVAEGKYIMFKHNYKFYIKKDWQ